MEHGKLISQLLLRKNSAVEEHFVMAKNDRFNLSNFEIEGFSENKRAMVTLVRSPEYHMNQEYSSNLTFVMYKTIFVINIILHMCLQHSNTL